MTPKEILDSFSQTLMQDERILSVPERALVTTLLQHARAARGSNPETQETVRVVIASAVGETVAQRAFAVLGESVVDQILKSSLVSVSESGSLRIPDVYGGTPPSGPPRQPEPPGVRKPGQQPPPNAPTGTPPPPRQPEPPGHGHPHHATATPETQVALVERPEVLPAKCVVLDEFLSPLEVADLTTFVLQHEAGFKTSELVSPDSESGVIDYAHRRSRVLMELGRHGNVILQRIKTVLPQVLLELGMEEFSIAEVEAQITASNDGDFFRFHSDNGSARVASRNLTFVYFFQREPRQFEGGELRIHDARLEADVYASAGSYQSIVPRQNQIVFFPCELLHEITPVKCPSRLFADSRFTLNGWLRR